ncbi:MAG: hypothetical protein KAS87_01395 [Candidatus Omnitrophica bacterium]|nr:hypothetical protein [Candidatus Omnitrophota bacterium]
MRKNKDKLLKFKGGRRLSIISLFLFLFLFSVFCPLSSVTADQIRIRTIITPVGSQSEKWGAKGLMVCIGGETISNGGCGFGVNTGVDASGNTVDFKADDVVIFEDKSPEDHRYTVGTDTVYAVKGTSGGVGGMVRNFSATDSGYVSNYGSATIDCSVVIPEGYVVVYAQKAQDFKVTSGGVPQSGSNTAGRCANPSADRVCSQTNIGDVGPITISNSLTFGCSSHCSSTSRSGACGTFAIAIQTN